VSFLTSHIDHSIRDRARQVAEKKMPKDWDRKNYVTLNVYNAYFIEAMSIEYGEMISQAHSHGYVSALSKVKLADSLKDFYEER